MFGAMPLKGAKGAIVWYYAMAAGVVDFSIIYDAERRVFFLRGGAVAPDAYKLRQTPLEFVVPTSKSERLIWPVLALTVKDGRISAELGEPGTVLAQ